MNWSSRLLTLFQKVPLAWRLRVVLGLVAAAVVFFLVLGWVQAWKNGYQRDVAIKRVDSIQVSLTKHADSLKKEISRYRSDSIKAATRMLNARRATDSNFTALDTVGKALEGQVPDSLLEMFRRGVDGLRTHITEERLMSDNALGIAVNARSTALALATTEEKRADNEAEKVALVERRPPFLLRVLHGTTRLLLVGSGAGVGARVGGPVGAVVGAVVGLVIPTGS